MSITPQTKTNKAKNRKPTRKMEDDNVVQQAPQSNVNYQTLRNTNDEKETLAPGQPYNGPYGFLDKEDDNEDLNDLPPADRAIYTYYNHENKIKPTIYAGLIFILLPVFIHTIVFVSEATTASAVLVRLIYLVFALLLVWDIKLFFQWINEDSISGMVAQRHTKIAYFALLGIISLSFFTSALFSLFAIRSQSVEGDNHWKVAGYVFGFLSPIIAAAILLAPLPLYLTSWELGMRIIGKKTRPLSKVVNGQTVPVVDHDGNMLQFYSIRLWEKVACCCLKGYCGLKLQHGLHYAFVLTGVGLGYAATVIQLYYKRDDREYHYYFCIFYLIVSALGLFLFMTQGSAEKRRGLLRAAPNRDEKSYLLQQSLLKEFIGLFYYLSALITVLVMNRDLIE